MSTFVPGTILAQGRRYTAVAIDIDTGSQITVKLADSSNAALSGAVSYGFFPSGLLEDQEIWARQILIGKSTGVVSLSSDGGASFVNWTLNGAQSVSAVAMGETSTPDYPHAYAGLSNGDLYQYVEAHGFAGNGTWSKVTGSTGSRITAMTLPYGSYGAVWLGCTDGSLWRYSPGLGLYVVAQLAGAITDLGHLQEGDTVYGICADSGTGFFMALNDQVEATVFSLDHSQGYTSLSTAGTRALAAAGATKVAWSPDSGASLGFLDHLPVAGPYAATALSWDDHNECYVLSVAGALYVTTDNGATWTHVTIPAGMTHIALDRHYPSVLYAWGSSNFCVSYDRAASWDTVLSGTVVTLAHGELSINLLVLTGNSWSGAGKLGALVAQSWSGAGKLGALVAQSWSGKGQTVSNITLIYGTAASPSQSTAIGRWERIATSPASDMTLWDFNGGASGYVRIKMTSANHAVAECKLSGETVVCDIGAINLGEWQWITVAIGPDPVNYNFVLAGSIYGVGGVLQSSAVSNSSVLGALSNLTLVAMLGDGHSLSSSYLDTPNDTDHRRGKMEVYVHPAPSTAAGSRIGAPTGDVAAGGGLGPLYMGRQVVGLTNTVTDTGGGAKDLTAILSNGYTIYTDGPYAT